MFLFYIIKPTLALSPTPVEGRLLSGRVILEFASQLPHILTNFVIGVQSCGTDSGLELLKKKGRWSMGF